MRIVPVVEVKAKFSAYLQECHDEPIIVTKNGKPIAVLLPVIDENELDRLILAYSPRLRKILEKSKQQIKQGNIIEHDAFWQDVDSEWEVEPLLKAA
jgi:prevent-host-death family protein